MAENIGELYLQLKLKTDGLQKDYDDLKTKLKTSSSEIEQIFQRTKLDFDNSLSNKKLSEVKTLHAELKKQLTDKINFDDSITNITEAKAKLSSVEGVLEQLNGQVKKTPTELSAWSNVITGINQGFQLTESIIQGVTSTIKEAVTKAAEVESLRASFKGTQSDIENMMQATAGTMDDGDLLKLSNKALALGISMEKIPVLFLLAKQAGDKFGIDVSEGFDKIINASEGAGRGLKSIGIETKLFKQYQNELAKAQGDSLANLDADTQKQINLEAIMKASGLTMTDVAARTKTSADEIKGLSVRLDESKERIGGMINKGLIPLLKIMNDSGTGTKFFTDAILVEGQAIIALIPMLLQIGQVKSLLAIKTTLLAQAETAAATEVVAANTAMTASIPMIGLVIVGLTALAAVVYKLANAENDRIDGLIKNNEVEKSVLEDQKKATESKLESVKAVDEAADSINKYANKLNTLKNNSTEYKNTLDKYNTSLNTLKGAYNSITITTNGYNVSQKSLDDVRKNNIKYQKEYNDQLITYNRLIAKSSLVNAWLEKDKLSAEINRGFFDTTMSFGTGTYNTKEKKENTRNANPKTELQKITDSGKPPKEILTQLNNYIVDLQKNNPKHNELSNMVDKARGFIRLYTEIQSIQQRLRSVDVQISNTPDPIINEVKKDYSVNTNKKDKNQPEVEKIDNKVKEDNKKYEIEQTYKHLTILESFKLDTIKKGLQDKQKLYKVDSEEYKKYAVNIQNIDTDINNAKLLELNKTEEEARKLKFESIDSEERGKLGLLNFISASEVSKLKLHKETLEKKLALSKTYYADESTEIKELVKEIKNVDANINLNLQYDTKNKNSNEFSTGVSSDINTVNFNTRLATLITDYNNKKKYILDSQYISDVERKTADINNDILYFNEKKKLNEEYSVYLKEKYKNEIEIVNEMTPILGAAVSNVGSILEEQLLIPINESMGKTEQRMIKFVNSMISELSKLAQKWATGIIVSFVGNLLFPGAGAALGAVGAGLAGGGGATGGGSAPVTGGLGDLAGGVDVNKLISSPNFNVPTNVNNNDSTITLLNNKLNDLIGSVQAMNKNLVNKDMIVNVNSNIDGMSFVRNVTNPSQLKLARNGVNQNG